MEMMRHPEETTNMRRQTVASYFRVCIAITTHNHTVSGMFFIDL